MNSHLPVIQVTPEETEERLELDQLRRSLAAVLESIEQLHTHDRAVLLARYQAELGELEHHLLCLEIDVLAMQRRIAEVQRRMNRGEVINEDSRADIELAIAQELRDWFQRVKAQEEALLHSRQLLETARVVPMERAQRVKTAYRKLARLLHPDVSPDHAALFQRHWGSVQLAYESWDADLLEALLEFIQGECPDAEFPSMITGSAELERLRLLLKTQTDRLAQLQSEIPFCYARWLDDPEWISARRSAVQADIETYEGRLAQLSGQFTLMLHANEGAP